MFMFYVLHLDSCKFPNMSLGAIRELKFSTGAEVPLAAL